MIQNIKFTLFAPCHPINAPLISLELSLPEVLHCAPKIPTVVTVYIDWLCRTQCGRRQPYPQEIERHNHLKKLQCHIA